ncbi:MAG: hypothetical protein ACTTIC_04985 [Helicobacteraceae bacterium]
MNSSSNSIDFYIFLWEQYNKSANIAEFEERVSKHLKDLGNSEEVNSVCIPALKELYSFRNTELSSTDTNVFFSKKVKNINENIYVDFLAKKIQTMNNVFLDVDGKENMQFIPEHITKNMVVSLKEMGLEKSQIKEIIKSAIRLDLELKPKDAIFFNGGKFLIKFFTQDEADKHFGGTANNELEQIINEYPKDYFKNILLKVTDNILTSDCNLKRTNNVSFHKNFNTVLQKSFEAVIAKDFSNQALLNSFAEYAFRLYFDEIVCHAVDGIFDLIGEDNPNIKNFVNFYDGKELYIENNMIEKPSITTYETAWNYFSISALMKERLKAKEIYEKEKVDADRITFFIKRLNELQEKLFRQKQDLDSLINPPTEEKEYQLLVTDIDVMSKEIQNRENKLKEFEEYLKPFREAFEKEDTKLQEIKNVFCNIIKNFHV